ncbi:helix-turn-helix domain-containing protein [Ginsengibacter hankyongi]|uniref:Helix-turn-helix domain-containing protein n=1 Tax=Ginsengibacter hankyongi TaxID=2607284 RepID=A0A5J5IIT6_9BACT|nr:helix-turn-helix domain-containing protein [Ginsengibacter hankyongi]KAA9038657.1 helix-turn-helix domain-containing protein [Ginsengibacter hankyongi]
MSELNQNHEIPNAALLPYEQETFLEKIRLIIREELAKERNNKVGEGSYETNGLTYKPLYKIAEVCSIFKVSKPTIYEWIKHGKLKPYKVRSRVYFLWKDLQNLFAAE